MEAASFPETSATVCYSTRRHVPEGLDHHQHRYENPKHPIKSLLFNRPYAVIQEYMYIQIYFTWMFCSFTVNVSDSSCEAFDSRWRFWRITMQVATQKISDIKI
jgi:hypothetical protein